VDQVAVVFAGGSSEPSDVVDLPDPALVVAADSGLHLAQALGRHVDVVVGDFDSVDADALARAEAAGARVERHPEQKDATDLELALDAAVAGGVTRIVVAGGAGGRLDHLLGNVLLFAAPAYEPLVIEARVGGSRVAVTHGRPLTVHGRAGQTVSLLPVGGPARGVTTEGLVYPLHGEDLLPGTSRGVSNVMERDEAVVALESGTLLVVQP
jgi:thiamine pyrophosphokinase